jgi:hypothetical protein
LRIHRHAGPDEVQGLASHTFLAQTQQAHLANMTHNIA